MLLAEFKNIDQPERVITLKERKEMEELAKSISFECDFPSDKEIEEMEFVEV